VPAAALSGSNAVNISGSSIFAIYKEVYGDRIQKQANLERWIYNQFEKSKTPFGGKYWTEPLQDEGGQSVGSYNQDEGVADPQPETTKEIQIKSRFHFATVRLSGFSIESAKKNLYAFARTNNFEIKSKTEWLLSQLNCQMFQAGKGILGSITTPITNAAGGSFTVDVTAGQTQGTSPFWFRKGMKVDVWNAALSARRNSVDTTTKGAGWQIASYNKTTNLVTIVSTQTTAGVIATDVVAYEDSLLTGTFAASDAGGKQLTGLATLIDDVNEGPQTVQNIDRNVFTIFRGNRMANGGTRRPMALDLIQQGSDQVEFASGEPPNLLVSGPGQRRNFLNLLWYDVRYEPQTLKGGYKVLQYNSMDYRVDKDCQVARLYMLNSEYFNKYEVKPVGLLDQAGTSMERVPQYDVYEALVGGYLNFGATRPNAGVKITDLIEP
jgi:hypothetical protein